MSNSFQSNFQFGNTGSARPIDPEQPMRILVMGDFSAGRGVGSVADRRFHRVDIDNFDEFLEKTAPTVKVRLGDHPDATVEIKITELDDFHPDNLYRDVAIFHELRELRKRLMNPSSFPQAVAELSAALSIETEESKSDTSTSDSESKSSDSESANTSESDAEMLGRVLGQSAKTVDTSAPRSAQVDIQSLIHQIVAPYIEPAPDPRQDEYVGHADAAIAGQMRAILHAPSFQSLESAWLALHFLVSQVTMSTEVQVFVWDVTKQELLEAGEAESDQLEDSILFRRLVTDREQIPFSMIVSNETFSHQLNDLIQVSRLGAIGAHSGGPFLAGASPQLARCNQWTDEIPLANPDQMSPQEENWQSIRTSPVARWIGLAGPRFLLRLPYGESTGSVDAFDFEEVDDPNTDHEALLWGNPSLFVATLLATSYLESGWSMTPGEHIEIGDLPALTYKDDGEVHLKACAEVFLSERVADRLLEQGLMPLMSFKNRNAVRVLRMQSVSSPAASLSGAWS